MTGAVGEYYLDLLLSLDAPVRLIYKSRLDAANVDDICYKLDRLAVVAGAAGAVDALGRGGGGVLHGDADDYPAVAFCEGHGVCAETVEHEGLRLHFIAGIIRAELRQYFALAELLV